VPRPGRTPWTLDEGEPSPFLPDFAGFERDELGRSYWPDPEVAIRMMYADCDPEDARVAASRLRPQGPLPNTEPCPLDALPSVPATMILTTEDACVSADWIRWTAAHRIDADVFELPGGHSPMLARPAELASILSGLA